MRNSALGLRALAFAAMLAGAAQAQAPNPPPSTSSATATPSTPEVVVVAPSPLSADRQTEAVGEINYDTNQMARWPHAVCIETHGVTEPMKSYVIDTIETTARSLRLPPPNAHCDPNVLIVFTADPAAAWGKLTGGRALHDAQQRLVRAPTDFDVPVTWLREEAEIPADGRTWIHIGASPDSTRYQLHADDTRIGTTVKTDATRLVVVVDADAITGLPVGGVAAYLSMVVLAPIRSSHPVLTAASALNLFRRAAADQAAEPGLTAWDRAYLYGLYTALPGGFARDQQQRIRETMTHASLR